MAKHRSPKTSNREASATIVRRPAGSGTEVVVEAIVPGAALSANHMYTRNQFGRMVLKAQGRAFQDRIVSAIAPLGLTQAWGQADLMFYKHGGYVSLEIELRFPDFLNGMWVAGTLGKTKTGQVRGPYKTLDASNYIKCIEDGVVRATGIDDTNHLFVSSRKVTDWTGDPEVGIRYSVWLPLNS